MRLVEGDTEGIKLRGSFVGIPPRRHQPGLCLYFCARNKWLHQTEHLRLCHWEARLGPVRRQGLTGSGAVRSHWSHCCEGALAPAVTASGTGSVTAQESQE